MSVDVIAAVRKHSRTKLAARLAMFAIADNAWSDGVAFPSQDELAESTLLSEKSIRLGLRQAEQLDELETRKARKGRSFFNVYRVTVGSIRLVDVDYGRLEKMGIRLDEPFTDHSAAADSTGKSDRLNQGPQPAKNDQFKRQNQPFQPADFSASNRNRKEPSEEPSAAAAGDIQDQARQLNVDTVLGELHAMRAGTRLRELAIADPDLTLAWIQVAKTDATRNPAAFVLAGVETGELPSTRGPLPGATAFDRCQAWIELTGCRLEPEDAHVAIDDWPNALGDVERQELHELLDQAIADRQQTAAEAAA